MKVGIEKLKTCLEATDEIVDSIGVIYADGKLSIKDALEGPRLVRSVYKLANAAAGAMPEIKDIDAEEAQALVQKGIPLLVKIASKFGFKVE